MKIFRLADEWRVFEARVLSPQASEVQRVEMRRAFYSGAAVLFHGLVTSLQPGAEVTEKDLALMDGIEAELNQFAKDLKRGVA